MVTSTRGLAAVPASPIGCEVGPLMNVLPSGIWKPGRCLEVFVSILLGVHCHEGLYSVSDGVWVGDPCQVASTCMPGPKVSAQHIALSHYFFTFL